MKNDFYVIEYQGGQRGCPSYFNAQLNHDWQWDEFDPDPEKFEVTVQYSYKAKHQVIEFDYWNEILVSERFVDLCEQFGMRYRVIPVEIIQSNGKPTTKKYFFLLTKNYKSILDTEKSEYELSRVLETGDVFQSKLFPNNPSFETITRFVVDEKKVGGSDIFRCTDIEMKYVCSQRFKEKCEKNNLQGLKFIPIDENFKSIPYWMQ